MFHYGEGRGNEKRPTLAARDPKHMSPLGKQATGTSGWQSRAEQGVGVSHLGLLLPPPYTCWIQAVMDIGDNHHECELGNILGWHMVNTYGGTQPESVV